MKGNKTIFFLLVIFSYGRISAQENVSNSIKIGISSQFGKNDPGYSLGFSNFNAINLGYSNKSKKVNFDFLFQYAPLNQRYISYADLWDKKISLGGIINLGYVISPNVIVECQSNFTYSLIKPKDNLSTFNDDIESWKSAFLSFGITYFLWKNYYLSAHSGIGNIGRWNHSDYFGNHYSRKLESQLVHFFSLGYSIPLILESNIQPNKTYQF